MFILDWQKDSVLLARGESRADRLAIEAVSLQGLAGNDSTPSLDATEAVKRAASQLSAKGDVTVLAARELVELRTLSIPKMDADDLPDIIRLQAQRQFASMTDAWPVDFVLLPASADQEMQTALVAALPASLLAEIESACTAAGLNVVRVLLRPLEVARMATHSGLVSSYGCAIVVCMSESMADILLMRDGQVVQVRSTRLPEDSELLPKFLQGEVRRSLVAGAAELSGGKVETTLLVATSAVGDTLVEPLKSATKSQVVRIQPEDLLTLRAKEMLDNASVDSVAMRVAGIGGAFQSSSIDRKSLIDFKHPKKRPPKQRNTRKWILAGAAAAALPLLFLGWYSVRVRSLNAEYEEYRSQIDSRKEVGEKARLIIAEQQTIDQFLKASPNWLDEITYIAQKMPGAEKVKLENPAFAWDPKGTSTITVQVKAVDAAAIAEFERSLRDDNHPVNGNGATQLPTPDGEYKWKSTTTIGVLNRGWDVSAAAKPVEAESSQQAEAPALSGEDTSESPSDPQPVTEES